jgi:hypothetical protein
MSDVTAPAKPAKAVPPIMKPAPQTLREVKPKTFSPSSLKPLGYGETEIMTIAVPTGWTFEDVMKPVAWSSIVGPIAANSTKTQIDRVNSLIYATTADHSFMAWLLITGIVRDAMNNPCGVNLICVGPSVDLKTGRPCPLNLKTGLPWVDPAKLAAEAA